MRFSRLRFPFLYFLIHRKHSQVLVELSNIYLLKCQRILQDVYKDAILQSHIASCAFKHSLQDLTPIWQIQAEIPESFSKWIFRLVRFSPSEVFVHILLFLLQGQIYAWQTYTQ